jgi:hypothetical protein
MTRVYIVVEGQTEESFVNEILAPGLKPRRVYLYPILLGGKGGDTSYARVQKDVLQHLKGNPLSYCSTSTGWAKDIPEPHCHRISRTSTKLPTLSKR